MYIFKVYRISRGQSMRYAFIAYIQGFKRKVFRGLDEPARSKRTPGKRVYFP